jgi:hypothetical protein
VSEPIDVTLTKSEKNIVFGWLTSAKFLPADFEWQEHELGEDTRRGVMWSTASTLFHRPTRYYFNFGRAYCKFVPGTKSKVEIQEHASDWANRAAYFHLWLCRLREEVDAPDLWATIGQEKALSTAASSADLDNRPFTAAEQNLIAARLDEIKGFLLEGQQFDAEQLEFLDRQFAYLGEASTRMGRKDWLNVLYGGLITVVVGAALAPDAAKSLLRLAAAAFQSLWGVAHGVLE